MEPDNVELLHDAAMALFERRADELIVSKNIDELKSFCLVMEQTNFVFDDDCLEVRYLYALANCYAEIYQYSSYEWYSDELSRAVISYRKALHTIRKIEFPSAQHSYLQSCIETNLGNYLSSQGRCFCCIPYWDEAFKRSHNPVSIIAKANNQLFIGRSIYDPGHSDYHYFVAYNLINKGVEFVDDLYPEQKIAYAADGNFIKFKAWFEANYELSAFDYFEEFEEEFKTKKQHAYLKWCGDNRLFINDLNDVCVSMIAYQDIMSLPSFSQDINLALEMQEELAYHGNFDELKNDYCYARYTFFSAKDIPNDQSHFFNGTYPHVEDMAHTITNLKANHYKSSFRTLYSLFDKIAYFLNRFFDLNDIQYDHKISFDSIFKELKGNKWQPHQKLKDSKNYFIHALFYILKDIRDVKDSTSVSRWLDPDAKAFSDIRNAIEHRSLKIVDDYGYTLIKLDASYSQHEVEKLHDEVADYKVKIQELRDKISAAEISKNEGNRVDFDKNKKELQEKLNRSEAKLYEKKKLSSHSVLITESEFESRLMTLMRLARNSIMYLSLAIHLEEENKPDDGIVRMPKSVPLK